MFVQAPAVKIYSGEHRSGDMDELVWFGQIANLARNTRQTLLECLLSHTSGTALKWVTLKSKRNAQARTQLKNIAKGTIIDTEGVLTDKKGDPILKFSILSDSDLAEAFGKHFLTYKRDDVETSRIYLEQNQCVQKDGQNLENFIVQFQTLLMEAEIDTSTVKDQLTLVVHFYNGLLPGLRKHGYTNNATLKMYNSLSAYWTFLRRHVQKDEARKLVEKDMQLPKANAVGTVPPSGQNARPPWSKEDKALYKLRKVAERDAKNLKRTSDTTSTGTQQPNKRRKFPQGHGQQVDTSSEPRVAGNFTEDKCFHSGLKTLQPGQNCPPGYVPPASPMPRNKSLHSNFIDTYCAMFPDMPRSLVIGCMSRQQEYFNRKDMRYANRCFFHNCGDHSTLACPAYRIHYPGGNGIPTLNPPPYTGSKRSGY
jgi:hypothetical protein